MHIIKDAPAASLGRSDTENVANGATVITDEWTSYLGLSALGYTHDRNSQRAATAHGEALSKLLPGVHHITSLAKSWLLGTLQGAVDIGRLPGYLDEFCCRFDGRKSTSRGLLFYRVLVLASAHGPVLASGHGPVL